MMFFGSLEGLEPVEHLLFIYSQVASDLLARVCNTVAECRTAEPAAVCKDM